MQFNFEIQISKPIPLNGGNRKSVPQSQLSVSQKIEINWGTRGREASSFYSHFFAKRIIKTCTKYRNNSRHNTLKTKRPR